MSYKHYKTNDPAKMILRDHLAFDRTELANERTLLAYARTMIVFFGGGFTITKLFPDDRLLVVVGYVAIIVALIVLIIGVSSFFKFRRKIREVYTEQEESE